MLIEHIPLSLWLLIAVVFVIASLIHKPQKSRDILPKVRAEDEPALVCSQIPFIGHVFNYVTQGPGYLLQQW